MGAQHTGRNSRQSRSVLRDLDVASPFWTSPLFSEHTPQIPTLSTLRRHLAVFVFHSVG